MFADPSHRHSKTVNPAHGNARVYKHNALLELLYMFYNDKMNDIYLYGNKQSLNLSDF